MEGLSRITLNPFVLLCCRFSPWENKIVPLHLQVDWRSGHRQNITTLAATYEAADHLTNWHPQGSSSDVKGKVRRGSLNLKVKGAQSLQEGGF